MKPDNPWVDRNVFVTGCTGLLGSWISKGLQDAGANVVGLVRDNVPRSNLNTGGLINDINVVYGEIEDYALIERILNEYQIATVFHLAAQTIVGIAAENPLSTLETNIRGTWHVLEAARRTSWIKQIIVASSDKAYGEHEILPYSEESSLQGRYPYDASKVCADVLSQSYATTYQLPVCITRFGNLFGAGDLNFNRLIPGTIRSLIRNERPIIRSDGNFTRDYIYVEDAAHGYLTLAENMMSNPAILGQAFNFSYGKPLDVKEMVDYIRKHMNRQDLQPKILGVAGNEITHQYLSASKAKEELGWAPKYHLENGLIRTIAWYKNWFKENANL